MKKSMELWNFHRKHENLMCVYVRERERESVCEREREKESKNVM